MPEDEPTPKQKQQHLLHSLTSPSSATSQHAAAPTISYISSAPVYSVSGAAGQSGSARLHSPVLTSSPSPPTAVGGGNAPLAHIDQSFQVPGVPPQPASALHPLAPQPVPMDNTSSVSSAYHQQPPGFVLGASVPNEGEYHTRQPPSSPRLPLLFILCTILFMQKPCYMLYSG